MSGFSDVFICFDFVLQICFNIKEEQREREFVMLDLICRSLPSITKKANRSKTTVQTAETYNNTCRRYFIFVIYYVRGVKGK